MSKRPMTIEETINTVNIRAGKKLVKRIAITAIVTVAAVVAVDVAMNKIEKEDNEN